MNRAFHEVLIWVPCFIQFIVCISILQWIGIYSKCSIFFCVVIWGLINMSTYKYRLYLVFGARVYRMRLNSYLKLRIGWIELIHKNVAKNVGFIVDSQKGLGDLGVALALLKYTSNDNVLTCQHYCDSVYGACYNFIDRYRIWIMQNSCFRLIFSVRRQAHISQKLVNSWWLCTPNRQ